MLNRYPLWKNITLIVLFIISIIYAIPNLYGEDPAIQVTGVHGGSISKQKLNEIEDILNKKKNIHKKSISLEDGIALLRFSSINMQMHAYEELTRNLGENYVVALNLVPATPRWLDVLGAHPIKLGLDLRGGIHFLIEVNTNAVLSKLQEQIVDQVLSKLHDMGVTYNNIRKIDRYGVEICFYDTDTRDLVMNQLFLLRQGLLINRCNNLAICVSMHENLFQETRELTIQQNISILRNRINQIGISNSLVQRYGSNYIIVELPGIQDIARAKEILGATATIEFRLVNTTIDINSAAKGDIPIDSEVKWTRDGQPIILYRRVILTGDHITTATYSTDEYNQPQVNISLDRTGGNIMSNFTENHIGEPMATLFVEYKENKKKNTNGYSVLIKKEEVSSVAYIQSRLSNSFRITGIKNPNEARELALLLRAGTLASPVQIIEERIIGPAMGKKNIAQGLKACLWSLISSIIFMVVYYKIFGVIAISALIINLILILGIISFLPGATLTMSSVAGIVLILAISVDANVLINERIKEEIQNGSTIHQAIQEGYKGAFSSIIDANITTLMTAIILYAIGAESIKGFAITTAIGVVTSIFTAIVITRAIINLLYGRKHLNKLPI